jgi:hypothetical protein
MMELSVILCNAEVSELLSSAGRGGSAPPFPDPQCRSGRFSFFTQILGEGRTSVAESPRNFSHAYQGKSQRYALLSKMEHFAG